ncbi:MAG TPA: alpha/beta hydrolase [Acetobacteraceae bacterium]|nr:alpha/beta hydrolase [Acetobacteraceae bacterium]
MNPSRRACLAASLAGMLVATVAGFAGGARLVTFGAVAAMHICKPFQALNLIAPRAGIVATTGIAYAPGPRHKLDLYAPARSARPAPVVVFFYGGGWETGDRATYRFVGASLAERGVVVAIPDYRLHPAVRFPAFEQDAAAAIAWVKANIGRHGGDARRLFLMGHSAGAQIAALLAVDPEYLWAQHLSPRDVCGVIGLAGPYDFRPASKQGQDLFGPPQAWARWQPITYASAAAPSMLLLAGASDRTIDPRSTLRFAASLQAKGGSAESRLFPGITHTAIVAALATPLHFLAPAADATLALIRRGGSCGPASAGETR